MFAKSSPDERYHLVNEDQSRTLCGLPVVPVIIDRAANTQAIHLTSEAPNEELCKECARIAGEQNSTAPGGLSV